MYYWLKKIFRFIFILWYSLNTQLPQIIASELYLSTATCNEGDDHWRPSLGIELILLDHYSYKGYVYGRTFSHIREITLINSFAYIFDILNNYLFTTIGPSILTESTYIDKQITSNQQTLNKTNYNVGIILGLTYKMKFSSFNIGFNWDSHIYTAGLSSIFLVTGRKQIISLTIGTDL